MRVDDKMNQLLDRKTIVRRVKLRQLESVTHALRSVSHSNRDL